MRLEDRIRLQLLDLLVQLNRLLEGESLFHHVFVLDGDHAVVDVSGELSLLGLLLVLEARVACAERIHLVPLTHLIAQRPHLVLH